MKLFSTRTVLLLSLAACGVPVLGVGCSASAPAPAENVGAAAAALASSTNPPGGLQPSQVPQFVAVTFDDNFSTEGMDWATGFFRGLRNPAGSGNPSTFDGAPVRTTFPCNSVYLGGMQGSWETGVADGHEIANHTVNHGDGIAYTADQWSPEIAECTSALVSGLSTPGNPLHVTGFRSPYLHYDDALFTVLVNDGFAYDTSIMGCWADAQTGKSCTWPYTMENGSPDANTIFTKFSGRNVAAVGNHAIWEMPVAVVFVPDDSLAAQYGFTAGLRQRVANAVAGEGNPNFFEQATGKFVGMDISLLLDGKMTHAEALATLEYTLDLRLAGNRAPMIFVAHTHVYASAWDGNAPGAQNAADRRAIVEDFVRYALTKPEVRMRPVADVLAWMKSPAALGACTPTTCAAQGRTCGSISDGCGATLACGTCAAGKTCSSAGTCQACVPTTCSAQAATCGSI
ncbi:MAG TPA: polysaccharide deacetylase family protein, partial [Polyangiaceae bacterium]